MYCKKCGQLIPDSAKFCPKCGLEVKRKDPLIYEIKCENCGSTMDYSETPESNIVFVCPQCGSKKILVKNAAEKNSESFQKDFESGEYGKNDNNDEIELVSFGNQGRLNQEQEKAVIPKEKTNEKNAPKSNVTFQRNYKENKNVYKSFDSNKKQSKVFRNIILFFLFVTLACCVYFYFQHNMMKFAISMIQAFLLISAWLNNRGFLRKDKKYLFILLTVLSLALFYPMIKLGNDFYKTDDQEEVYVWPETELGVVIPNPRLKKGKISWSHDDKFYITYSDANESDFTGYIKECQDSGFNVDHSQSSSSFTAYNSDGYYVCVHYWSGLKEISITAQAPEKLGENYWPTTGMAEILPKPDESLGLVIRDTSELLSVDIHGNKKDVFIYAEKCIEEGFSVNYQRTEKSYYAENEQGYSLKIVYEGGEIINIRLEAPATAEEPESLDTTSLTDTKNVDTEYNVQTEDNNSPDVTQRESAASLPNEPVQFYFDLDFVPNIIFSTYDIDFYLDNSRIATIPHGQDYSHLFELTPGKHEILLCKKGNKTIKGEAEIVLSEDMTVQARIFVYSNYIHFDAFEEKQGIIGAAIQVPLVENMQLSHAVDVLKQAGFNNIHYVDSNNNSIGFTSSWTVKKQNVSQGDLIDKNSEIVLTCIKSDDYASNLFNNHLLSEINEISTVNNYDAVEYYSIAKDNITSLVETFSEDEKKNWFVKSTKDSSTSTLKKANVYLVYTGNVQMPNITGNSLDTAIQVLKTNNLYNYSINTVDGSTIWIESNWRVKSQSVSAGTIISGDTNLSLVCEKSSNTSSTNNNTKPVSTQKPESNSGNSSSVSASNSQTKPQSDQTNEIITKDNNEDFAALVSSKYVDPDQQQAFVEKYYGRTIEFDCLVISLEQDPRHSTIYTYILVPGENTNDVGAALFILEDASMFTFKWNRNARPEYLEVGSKIRMRAKIISGDDSAFIYLRPLESWAR